MAFCMGRVLRFWPALCSFLPGRETAVGLGHGADAPCQLGGQGCAVHPPAPVFAQGGGVVDPGAVVQAQIVLQGDDAPPAHRGHRGAGKVPVEGLDGAGVPVEVPADRRPLFGQDAAVPARHRLVVVGCRCRPRSLRGSCGADSPLRWRNPGSRRRTPAPSCRGNRSPPPAGGRCR